VAQQDLEIVRASYQALNTGDMAGALEAVDPGIEIFDHDIPDATGSYRLDGAVWTLRDRKGIRLDYYGSRAEALEAVGLPG
jgi:ketosteroid isomerase-like protein